MIRSSKIRPLRSSPHHRKMSGFGSSFKQPEVQRWGLIYSKVLYLAAERVLRNRNFLLASDFLEPIRFRF